MTIKVKIEYLKMLKKPGARIEELLKVHVHGEAWLTLDTENFVQKQLEQLSRLAQTDADDSGEYAAKKLVQRLKVYFTFLDDPDDAPIKKMEVFPDMVKEYMRDSKNKWLFHEAPDGYILPYFIRSIDYTPPRPATKKFPYRPPYCTVYLEAWRNGKSENTSENISHTWVGSSVYTVFKRLGYFKETEKAAKEYESHRQSYNQFLPMVGHLFWGRGMAEVASDDDDDNKRWYSTSFTKKIVLDKDGHATRVIMDNDYEKSEKEEDSDDKETPFCDMSWWDGEAFTPEDEKNWTPLILPIWPYVNVFELDKHRYVELHIGGLTSYEYQKDMRDKLVLDAEILDLVDILLQSSARQLEDIVSGKASGVIVIASGPPGVGKTLTSEVFCEVIERPLYMVQCSQIGTDEETIEKNLGIILKRATRWNAILQLDEADVYIRHRGEDIQQNAIVGIFLRLLEYYRGIMFMTTNRATTIDDAIVSRATAYIRYDRPDEKKIARLWRILGKQYGVIVKDDLVRALTKEFPVISGRTIRNLLKLARLLADQTGKPITLDTFKLCARFQKMEKVKSVT